MFQSTTITSQEAEDWKSFVVPQATFSEEGCRVWDLLFARQVELLGSSVVSPFLQGLHLLRLSRPGIPDLDELNEFLIPHTGWRTVPVPGLVPDEIFFAMLRNRIFPIGNFIRRRDQLDYLEEPDCFHDLFGHIPMLAHPGFATMVEHFGHLGLAAHRAGEVFRVARLYWHTVEFGLAWEQGELRILGAGLASSFGEARFSIESKDVQRQPFSVRRAVHTAYRPDAFQPRYLVSSSLEETIAQVLDLDDSRLLQL